MNSLPVEGHAVAKVDEQGIVGHLVLGYHPSDRNICAQHAIRLVSEYILQRSSSDTSAKDTLWLDRFAAGIRSAGPPHLLPRHRRQLPPVEARASSAVNPTQRQFSGTSQTSPAWPALDWHARCQGRLTLEAWRVESVGDAFRSLKSP